MDLNVEKFDELFDEAMKTHGGPVDEAGVMSLMKQMLKRGMERALQGELTHHLGYEKHAAAGRGSGNSRNGTSPKSMKGDLGEVVIEVPRDRKGAFEPQMVGKPRRGWRAWTRRCCRCMPEGCRRETSKSTCGKCTGWR